MHGELIAGSTFAGFSFNDPNHVNELLTCGAAAGSSAWVQVFTVQASPSSANFLFSNVINSSFHYHFLFDYDDPAVGSHGEREYNLAGDLGNAPIPWLDYTSPGSLTTGIAAGDKIKLQWAHSFSGTAGFSVPVHMAFAVAIYGSFIEIENGFFSDDGVGLGGNDDTSDTASSLSLTGQGPPSFFVLPAGRGLTYTGAFAWDDPAQTPTLSGSTPGWVNLGVYRDSTTGWCGMAVGKTFVSGEADSTVTASFSSPVNVSGGIDAWQQMVIPSNNVFDGAPSHRAFP